MKSVLLQRLRQGCFPFTDYVVPGLPTTYFIDDKGLIYDVQTGALDYNRLVDITSICFK
ncbi:MAG TPA: hypothetical protein GXZ31_07395 [Thermoanaerobacterales bacterium]|nr:hypothetical protein [Thermoanaerobacterales bacterium]